MRRVQKIRIVSIVAAIMVVTLSITLIHLAKYTAVEHSITPAEKVTATDSLFAFDPNTVSYEQLRTLGFEKQTAVAILKYRSRGKVFEIAEEFALCYGVTDSIFAVLRPYITIGEQFRAKPDSLTTLNIRRWKQKIASHQPHPFERFRIDTVSAPYLQSIGFSYRQAEGLIEYRDDDTEGISNMAELRDCWAVSPQMADSLARYVIFPEPKPYGGKVEINSADSAALAAVRGIGPKSAAAIVEYRKLLGGYVKIEQLSELKCVTSENFAQFSSQICCDSCVFSKIDINFAPASELELHPYMTRGAINKIIQLRKSKGGWESFEEIVKDDIFTQEQAASLAPYLYFDTTALEFSEEDD